MALIPLSFSRKANEGIFSLPFLAVSFGHLRQTGFADWDCDKEGWEPRHSAAAHEARQRRAIVQPR